MLATMLIGLKTQTLFTQSILYNFFSYFNSDIVEVINKSLPKLFDDICGWFVAAKLFQWLS